LRVVSFSIRLNFSNSDVNELFIYTILSNSKHTPLYMYSSYLYCQYLDSYFPIPSLSRSLILGLQRSVAFF
jgi:hypothetical protein